MKKIVVFFFAVVFMLSAALPAAAVTAADSPSIDVSAKSAVLMDYATGTVIFEKDADVKLPPASVTKIMSLILIMEAMDRGQFTVEDIVTASEHACSMGGTQIYLEVGEQMSVDDLLKSIVVPSANDATVAMAEYVAGSESEFVSRMNARAAELGMENTNFTNCTGLFDDAEHYTTARDIAIMTRELLKHEKIFDYTTIWMDTLRNGEFGLANTNKLIRTYPGMNGMKTGYTKESLYCYSGTAERNGMTLIAAVMGSPSSDERFKDASKMLDYGFANYSVVTRKPEPQPPIKVLKGQSDTVNVEVQGDLSVLIRKGQDKLIVTSVDIADSISAPVKKGTEVGTVTYTLDGQVVKECKIVTSEDIPRVNFMYYIRELFMAILG